MPRPRPTGSFAGVADVTEIGFQPTAPTATPEQDRAMTHATARATAKTF